MILLKSKNTISAAFHLSKLQHTFVQWAPSSSYISLTMANYYTTVGPIKAEQYLFKSKLVGFASFIDARGWNVEN